MVQLANGAVLQVRHYWHCPNCGLEDQTVEPRTHTRFHKCPALAGITAPMLPVGSKARVITREREDYIGQEDVQLDANGRPIMSVITERDDGSTDVIVFAPTSRARLS